MKDLLISVHVEDLRLAFDASWRRKWSGASIAEKWKVFYREVHAKAVVTADDGKRNQDLSGPRRRKKAR